MRKLLAISFAVFNIYGSSAQAPAGDAMNSINIAHPLKQDGQSGAGDKIYNIDPYSGTASVSIPIYDYSIDGLNLGISLAYDTRGIRVDQVASSTGLGWSLNTGGYIERSVHGLEDDVCLAADSTPPICGRIAGNQNLNEESDHYTAVFAGRTIEFGMNRISGFNGSNGLENSQIFTYPKSNVSISMFFTDAVGTFYPWYNNSISSNYPHWMWPVNMNNAPVCTSVGFRIMDEASNQYFFVRGDYRKAYYNDTVNFKPAKGTAYYPTDRWVLIKIRTHTGAEIKYSYNKFDNISYPSNVDQQVQENFIGYTNQDNVAVNSGIKVLVDSAMMWRGGVSHLSRIEYPNGTVVNFGIGGTPAHTRLDVPNAYALDSIIIHRQYSSTVYRDLTYRFNYSYTHVPNVQLPATSVPYASLCSNIYTTAYGSSYTYFPDMVKNIESQASRLRLESIDMVGSDHVTKEKYYAFTYNSIPLPARLSPSQDYFGYYNGKTPGSVARSSDSITWSDVTSAYPALSNLAVPRHTFTQPVPFGFYKYLKYGVDKNVDASYLIASNLVKVENGKGGTIEFFYRNHTLTNPANAYNNAPAPLPTDYEGDNANDGLCIDKIVTNDGYSLENKSTVVYTFTDGERFFQGGYFWYPTFASNYTSAANVPAPPYNKVYSCHYITTMLTINGANHGYRTARSETFNWNNTSLGYAVSTRTGLLYNYTNPSNNVTTVESNLTVFTSVLDHTFPPKAFARFRMGLPLESRNYDANGVLTSYNSNTYQPITGFGSTRRAWPNQYHFFYFDYFDYHYLTARRPQISGLIDTGILHVVSSTSVKYSGAATQSITKYYTYDNWDNITKITWTNSTGEQLELDNTYAWYVFKSKSELFKTIGGTKYLLKSTASNINADYRSNSTGWAASNYSPNEMPYINVDGASALMTDRPVSPTDYASYAYSHSTDFVHPVTEVMLRDSKANVIQVKNNENTINAAIWDTRLGLKIADVSNALYRDIAYTSFEGAFANKGIADENKGNWDFNPGNIQTGLIAQTSKPIMGRFYYTLPQHNTGNDDIRSVNTLTSGKKYILSFWAYSAPDVVMGSAAYALTQVRQVNAWKLYTAVITGNGNILTLGNSSGTGIPIDELRLYPQESSVTTTNYDPLFGPHSQNDNLNNIIYYEYDIMGRLNVTRDIDNNILSVQKSAFQDPDN